MITIQVADAEVELVIASAIYTMLRNNGITVEALVGGKVAEVKKPVYLSQLPTTQVVISTDRKLIPQGKAK